MENKRGQGLSVNAIILIVLGVIVLVMLVLGFTIGWDKIAPWIKTDNNVATIAQACATACSTNSVYDYCSVERELKNGTNEIKTSCAVFSVYSAFSKYGIQKCSAISCNIDCKDIKFDSKTADESTSACGTDKEDITSIAKVETLGNKCCIAK